ncbi:hypothetical protein L227DRAFT_40932 [Lentinus tigrinus ALCF2SS1-6]|uniref:Uncharacterized protein n=1 Tax=Lentinus tigrinus ALCF2SS1-6 TaxID=1328759 RepID=A0A5C2RLQ1_9APHY|nr:hypothetical protein L227DRAFT_40932 [Lentinus tigrinus ALCF2SS1-6]
MSQQSPSSAGPPQTSSMSSGGLPPGLPNLNPQQMQQLAHMNPQTKAMQIQRIMHAQQQMANSNMQGMGGGMGGGMQGMGMGGMSRMSPAQLHAPAACRQCPRASNQPAITERTRQRIRSSKTRMRRLTDRAADGGPGSAQRTANTMDTRTWAASSTRTNGRP